MYTSFQFGKRKSISIEPTFFGNVADTIPNKTALEIELGLTSSDITTFDIVGNDIYATIVTEYILTSFWNKTQWVNITKFLDNSEKVINTTYQGIRSLPSLNEVYLPRVETFGSFLLRSNASLATVTAPNLLYITGGSTFVYDSSLNELHFPELLSITGSNHFVGASTTILNIPKCIELGASSLNGMRTNGTLTCHSSLATSNNGGENDNIVYLRSRGWTINYVN